MGARPRVIWLCASATVLLALAALLTGCGHAKRSITGVVTTLTPRLCVGRPAARGLCLTAPPAILKNVRVGECVRVAYSPHAGGRDDGAALSVAPETGCS